MVETLKDVGFSVANTGTCNNKTGLVGGVELVSSLHIASQAQLDVRCWYLAHAQQLAKQHAKGFAARSKSGWFAFSAHKHNRRTQRMSGARNSHRAPCSIQKHYSMQVFKVAANYLLRFSNDYTTRGPAWPWSNLGFRPLTHIEPSPYKEMTWTIQGRTIHENATFKDRLGSGLALARLGKKGRI